MLHHKMCHKYLSQGLEHYRICSIIYDIINTADIWECGPTLERTNPYISHSYLKEKTTL